MNLLSVIAFKALSVNNQLGAGYHDVYPSYPFHDQLRQLLRPFKNDLHQDSTRHDLP
jgi:hypothetical protein